MVALNLVELRVPRVRVGKPLLEVEDLSVRVGVRTVFEGLSLTLFPGHAVLVVGANGSGKSSLLHAIAGAPPARILHGSIRFRGDDVTRLASHERARLGMRLMPQRDHVFPALSIGENLQIALGRDGYGRFREAFPDWADDLEFGRPAGHLSGGQKKRLGWAMSVLSESSLILADEPDTGLSKPLELPGDRAFLLVTHDASLWSREAGS